MTPLVLLAGALTGAFLAHPPDSRILLTAAVGATAWHLLGGRTILLAALSLGLATAALADRAWQDTTEARQGFVSGVVRLVSDPRPMPGGGWRAEVRLDGHRYDAEFAPSATVVGELLAGEGVEVTGDLDGDGRREVIGVALRGLHVFDALTGVRLWSLPERPFGEAADRFAGSHRAVLADVDGDGAFDLLAEQRFSLIRFWRNDGETGPARVRVGDRVLARHPE